MSFYLPKVFNLINNKKFSFWLLLLVFSFFTVFALGRTGRYIISYGLWFFISLYVLKKLSNKILVIYLTITVILVGIYLPQGINYGALNVGIVGALLETTLGESLEYIQDIPMKIYVYELIYLLLFIGVLFFNKSTQATIHYKKIFYLFSVVVFLSIFHKPLSLMFKEQSLSMHYLSEIKYYPLRLPFEFFSFKKEYLLEREKMKELTEGNSSWKINSVSPKYKTYVVVIGESMRADYMSLYNYPVITTPFLDKVNATVFNHFIAPAGNTPNSLKRMLFLHQPEKLEEQIYPNTLITLANAANFKTYWLSNQGKTGTFDTISSAIAYKADYQFFTKIGNFSSSNASDLKLIPEFKKAVDDKEDKNKLIVLHLMGSHSRFCKRLDKHFNINNIEGIISSRLSCYLSSIKQTDKLIETLYQYMKTKKDNFSIMYFSDHGLSHKTKKFGGISLMHGWNSKQNYDIPLIIISSDDKKKTYIDNFKSGYFLLGVLANWLGIKEQQLMQYPDFFNENSHKPIKVFNMTDVINYKDLKNDPAVLPSQ